MAFVFILSFFMKTALADFILVLNPEQPYIITEFSILETIHQEGIVYRQSAWFQYLPLTSTVYTQSVGMLDSNCYHLFSSVEKQSKSLNFLHYDCQDHEQMTITKIIKFIGNDDQQYSFEFNINAFEYENQWYYFEFIIFPYNNSFQIIIIKNEQILKNEILNVLPFKDEIIIQKIGGDLVIVDSKLVNISNGDKFAIFPGKIMPIMNNNNIFNFAQAAIILARQRKICRCQRNSINNLIDSDYNYLYTSIYTSQFSNCNSFIFSGWFKINEIIKNDKEMTFQFIKLTSNMQNTQLQNQNISPLQLFYKLSQDLNEIIITSYSYTFPFVTLDFTNDPFLITQKFKIINNIQLWHLLYVKLVEDIWDLNIKFYEQQQVYEYKIQIIVKQFHQIYYKLYLGNLQQSTSNYLNIMGRNLYFYNCNQNFQQKNCHQSCGECDGPTYQDCLSCSIESQRIYLPEYKQCVCPYYTIDENNECMSYLDFDFKLISNIEYNEGCNYGQFELNGFCYQCPGLLNSQTIGCLECVMNPTDWQRSPFCETHLYLNQDGSTSEFQEQFQIFRQYFTFNGIDLELCSQCQESSLTNQNNINQDIAYKQESFKNFCFSESSLDQCYRCNIQSCKICIILITGEVCLQCHDMYILNDDHCTMFSLGKIEENNCLSPYYISSTKECKLCTIENCIYCFEYVIDNLTLTTLYKNFKQFNGDDNIQVGCAMCKDGYVFDFRIDLCVKQTTKIESCLRSYINNEGIEQCTLSTKSDFSISREIINCEQFISNCLQCFLTVQSILRCIICKEGYTTSITEVNGQCNISKRPYQIISIEGNSYLKDAWMQRIQSFMESFLPNSYFYPLSLSTYQIEEIAITCKEGYQLAKMRYCIQYCDSNCQECQLKSSADEYFCNKCPLDYFKQNQRVQIKGICQTCSLLCAYCQSRGIDEITQTQPNFIQTEDNEIFFKKCYLPSFDPNIIILPQQFIPIYCLDKSCQNNLLYEFYNHMCSQERFLMNNLLTNANIKYLNQVGVQQIIIQLELPIAYKLCSNGIYINCIVLKENIFSLKKTTLIINGNAALFTKTTYKYLIENFDTILMSNFTMILDNFQLNFGNSKLKLTMKNIVFIGDQQQQKTLLLNSNQFNNIDLVNITISNAIFSESSFFYIDSLEFKEQIHIDTFLILNSTFLNSNLFLIKNSQLSMYIYNLQIENCTLVNSSIINMKLNLSFKNITQISTFIMKNCKLIQSYLFYFLGQVNLFIENLNLYGNTLQNSSFLASSYNTSIIDATIEHNILYSSSLIITNDMNVTGYFLFIMKQFKMYNLISDNSNLFQISTNSLFQNLIIQMSNILIYNVQRLDNFNYQNYIFKISHCSQCSIKQIEINNTKNITALYFLESDVILIENFKFLQDIEKRQVHFSQSCRLSQYLQNQLIHIHGFNQFKLQNGEIIDCQLFDSTLIKIQSTLQDQAYSKQIIEINNLQFKRNIIEQTQQTMLSLLSIYSENRQIITIQNLQFVNNFFHQYEDDPNENSAGLIYIHSTQGEIQIHNIFCQENAITNSSASFIYIISQSIFINNYIINNHNIINQQLWSQFYKLEIDQQYNQDQINQIIEQIYPINVIGGAAKIITQQFICTNSIFQNILASTSSIFEIRTQGLGVVKFNNISSNLIFNTKRDNNDNSGCININSQNSNLDLELQNSNFRNVQNGISTAIITIKPSQRITKISFKHIQIINCFSFLNQIFQIQFSTYNNQHLNQLSINNMTIIFDELEWIMYLSKFGLLSSTEIAQIIDDNSIFNIVGGQIYINQFYIRGILISPIFKIINSIKIEIRHCYINDVQSFYPQQLIILNQQSNSTVLLENLEIQRFQIYSLNMEQYQFQKIPQFRVAGCQIQQLSYLTNFNSKILIDENIKQLSKQSQKISYPLIQVLSSNSQSKLILNQVKLIQNNCLNYTLGLLFIGLSDFKFVRIDKFQCFKNQIQEYGCLYFKADEQNSKQQQVMISNSVFIQNNGSQGTGIQAENIKLLIHQCKILGNYASKKGGGILLNINKNEFNIYSSIFMLNRAKIGGGIYFQQQINLNQDNFKNSFLLYNNAEIYANNLVEAPTHLSIYINQLEMPSEKQLLDNLTILAAVIQPYNIIEQGKAFKAQRLMIPSNQQIKNYKIYIPKFSMFRSYIEVISIVFKNRFNENLENLDNSSCLIETTINFENKTIASSERMVQSLSYDQDSKAFDLSSLSFSFDPYFQDNKILAIELNCKAEPNDKSLQYYIYAKTLKCQQGEFYVDKGCQVCQSNQGFYSVTYNTTKCSIFDKEKFENITSNKIKLLEGFWRPNYLSDYTERCIKNPIFCSGGWDVGNKLCNQGHVGGLCEECDNFDVRGDGMFYRNLQNAQCFGCNRIQDSIIPFVLTSIWSLISILITLKSIEKSNRLFSSLKIRQRFSKIIFKLDQDHESILIKMLLNYLWIFSVIFTFNTNFSFSINFIELTSNSSYFMANNLDCYLSQLQNLELIYIRIIAMLILIAIQLLIIWFGFTCYSLCKNWTFNKSIISNTVLYLYVSNYAALVKQLCSILSKRQISNIAYIQGDVSLIYGTETHMSWIFGFAIPGLGVIGILIPFSLFFLMYINREQLDQIKLRRHICYLFNEYNSESYYWEQIKLSKKTVIIIILTYFESNVLLTASLLGLCLLFYQLLAVKQKPYIIQSLNFLDIQTGQICSITIFISAAKYVAEKENATPLSILLQIFIIILCIRLCYPFIINIFRVYFKKYKVAFIEQFHKIFRSIKADCFLTKYLNNQLKKLNFREQRRRSNFAKLRCHLIQISKLQIGHQKQRLFISRHMISVITSQSTMRYRQTVTITDVEMNKLISP